MTLKTYKGTLDVVGLNETVEPYVARAEVLTPPDVGRMYIY